MSDRIELLWRGFVTHDVQQFIFTRPSGFDFQPGQGVELAIDEEGWSDQGRPFTPTSSLDDRVLEFLVKRYPGRDSVTDRLHRLTPGAGALLSDPFGTITYRGPGVFLAGGAGVTPFVSILRRQAALGELEGNTLWFSNKRAADVLCERELQHYLGDRCLLLTTREESPGYLHRHIDRALLAERIRDFDQLFYLCGPDPFVADLKVALAELGAASSSLIFEE